MAVPTLRPVVMPEAFDGEGDWAEYLSYFNQCATINQWSDAQKASFLGVRLRGAALRFHATIPQVRQQTWAHVMADLAQRFAPDANVRQYKAQFKARRRRPKETLAALADDLRRLVARAYPTMDAALQRELVRDQFIEALTPAALKVRLQEHPPNSIQEAIEMAIHLERIWLDAGVLEPSSAVSTAGMEGPPVFAVAGQAAKPATDQTPSGFDRLAEQLSQLAAKVDALVVATTPESQAARYSGPPQRQPGRFSHRGYSRGRGGYQPNPGRPQYERKDRPRGSPAERQTGRPSGNQ